MVAPFIKRRRRAEAARKAAAAAAKKAAAAPVVEAPAPVVEAAPAPVVEETVEEVVEVVVEEATPDLGSLRKWELVELAEAAGHDVLGLTKRQLVDLLS